MKKCSPLCLALWLCAHLSHAQSSSIAYQGRLADGPAAATGLYDFRFELTDGASVPVGGALTNSAVLVSNGLFNTSLDFGASAFDGSARLLSIAVRTNGSTGTFTALSPLQPIRSTPHALVARSANWSGIRNVPLSFGTNSIGAIGGSLDLTVDGQRVWRLQGTADTPNIIGGSAFNAVADGVVGATISGGGNGAPNYVGANYGVIGGGWNNSVLGQEAFIGGGHNNIVSSNCYDSAIAGGAVNTVASHDGFIGAGAINTVQSNAYASSIGAGYFNTIETNAFTAVIAGGYGNIIAFNSMRASIGGGIQNKIEHDAGFSTIAGGEINITYAGWSTLGGGKANTNYSTLGVIAGGYSNSASNDNAVVSGGYGNRALGYYATVGGGLWNTVTNISSIVGGGRENLAGSVCSSVLGGYRNQAIGGDAAVGGGFQNIASGLDSTIPGGNNNTASGDYSFAAGRGAHALHNNTFVWSDTPVGYFASSGDNQFLIHASGGFGLNLTNPAATLDVNGSARIRSSLTVDGAMSLSGPLSLGGASSQIMLNDRDLYLRNDVNHGVGWYGTGKLFANEAPNGPVLYGYAGGALGTTWGGQKVALRWDNGGNVSADGAFRCGVLQTTNGNFSGTVTANAFSGNGANLSGINASALASGTLSDSRLSSNVPLLNGSPSFSSNVRLADTKLWLRGGTDTNHGLGWYSTGTFAGSNPDGPVLFGCAGGALGTACGTPKIALKWDSAGNLNSPGTLTCSSVNQTSDRNAKRDFQPADASQILGRLATLPITTWSYLNEDPSVRHLGPMAQDFHAAFGLGADDTHITTIDEGGVALAAIQALNNKVSEQARSLDDNAAAIARLTAENKLLQGRLEKLEQLLLKSQ